MSFRISIAVRGVEKMVAMLGKIPHGAKGVVAEAVGRYWIGNERHGLKHYATYNYISRKKAYGVSFFSDKQRRWFFANMPAIPYRRTGAQGKAWHLEGSGTTVRMVNRDPSVKFTRGQTQLHKKMGWQTAIATIKSNWAGGMKAGFDALMAWIRS